MSTELAAHSKLGASSYERYKNCPGSIRESAGIENTESEYAKEGSFAHGVGEMLLREQAVCVGDTLTINGDTRVVSEEMFEAVMVYVDYCRQFMGEGWRWWIEKKLDLTKYYPDLFGTGDFIAYTAEEKRLVVVDYKHGAGVGVEVDYGNRPNSQLMFYGLGALHELKLPVKSVVLAVVQPRCYHSDGPVRSISVSPMEVLDFSYQLIADAKATEDPKAPLKSGDHCRFCPAACLCPELKSNLPVKPSPFTDLTAYEPEQLAKALSTLPAIETYVKAVREFAYREAINGRVPPGFKLVDKRASRKWKDPHEAYAQIYKISDLKHSDISDDKLKSPAQIEKLLDKEQFEKLQDLIVQESSGKTLVSDSDKRKEVDASGSPFTALN